MKLQLLSDIHLEFRDFIPALTDADYVVLAGDIGVKYQGVVWAHDNFVKNGRKVIYVPGNHEFYGNNHQHLIASLRKKCLDLEVIPFFGPEDHLIHGDYLLMGGTYWTDLKYKWQRLMPADFNQEVVKTIHIDFSDYYSIMNGRRNLTCMDTQKINTDTRYGFMNLIAKYPEKKAVVITHHAPSIRSSLPRFETDPTTAFFVNCDESFITNTPNIKLWLHGHVHNCNDYMIGDCRVVSNPRGYVHYNENTNWSPDLVLEI